MPPQAAKEKAAALKQRAARAVERAERSVRAPLLSDIHAAISPGPLTALSEWAGVHARVEVVTRHSRGERGRMQGILQAADRFMNMVLADAHEKYTVLIKEERTKECAQLHASSGATSDAGGSSTAPQVERTADNVSAGTPDAARQQAFKVSCSGQCAHSSHEAGQQQLIAPRSSVGGSQGKGPVKVKVRWCRKQVPRERLLPRVLIRGDSIVSVRRIDHVSVPTTS